MKPGIDSYIHVNGPVPHHERGREILRRHPEISALFGADPTTAIWALFLVVAQTGLAIGVAEAPFWLVLLLAWAVGAFFSQGLWVMIHEAGHGLVFKSTVANELLTVFANLPMLVPSGTSFNRYHARHHASRGVYDQDADLADHWEARLVGQSAGAKLLWQLFYWFFQAFRVIRLRRVGVTFWDRWVMLNVLASVTYTSLIAAYFGPWPLVYLFASMALAIGPHPLGARWIQEHFVLREGQETYSYYGWLNRITFNVGYHNEHHDLPGISWRRLPQCRKIAPEMYDTLMSHDSWTRLWLRFLFDRNITLYSRVARSA